MAKNTYKTKKDLQKEIRNKQLKNRSIRSVSVLGDSQEPQCNAFDFKEVISVWIRDLLEMGEYVAFLVTPSFNFHGHERSEIKIAEKLITDHYRQALVRRLIDRRRPQKFRSLYPKLILFPEYGRGYQHLHYHGFLIVHYEIGDKLFDKPELLDHINNDFREMSSYACDYHLKRAASEDINYVTTYCLKKYADLPSFVREEGDFLLLS